MEIGLLVSGFVMLLLIVAALVGILIFIYGITRKEVNKRLTKTGAIIAGVFGLIYFSLDSAGPSEVTSKIYGTYKFVYPSGQVETLTMKEHQSFTQAFYLNLTDYTNKKSLYTNNGNWWTNEEQINFEHWLSFCNLRNPDSILPKPELATMLNVYWHPPYSGRKARIDIYAENGYVLEKVD